LNYGFFMKNLSNIVPLHVRKIAPYQPGKPISELAREMGLEERTIVKLASNENPLGVSPKALDAMRETLSEIARYPDGNGFVLKNALSRKFGVDQAQIVLGNGSNDVLELVARAFLAPGTEVVFSQHAFAVYPLVTQATGAIGVAAPAKNYGHDLDAIHAAITSNTRLIYIANPNNPTGTLLGKQELYAFLKKVPNEVMVVLDEAYDEYLSDELKSEAIGWLKDFDNLILTRTLSKAYGLAGLRVGFLLANTAVADMINRVRQPFNVNNVALAAAAAVLGDDDFVNRTRAVNDAGMKQLTAGLERLGLDYIPSYGNFVCFRAGDAMDVYRKLLQKGVIVRPVGNYELPEFLRVSIGLTSEIERFLVALEEVLQGR